jgi:hypothetical protein
MFMSASEDHAAAVTAATAEAQALATQSEQHLKTTAEATAGAVIAAFSELQGLVTSLAAQADATKGSVDATIGPAEEHVSATTSAGQGTLPFVLAAQEACQNAVSNAGAANDFFATLTGAVEEAKNTAVASIMAMLPQLDDGVEGTKAVIAQLEQAAEQITNAQTTR